MRVNLEFLKTKYQESLNSCFYALKLLGLNLSSSSIRLLSLLVY